MTWLLLLPAFALGGLGRRCAGGVFGQWFGWDTGALFSRSFYGAMVGAAAFAGGATWWQSLLLIPAIYVGCTWPNKIKFPASWRIAPIGGIGLGRQPGGSFWRDALGLGVHGLVGTALPALGAWWCGYGAWWLLIVAGAAIVVRYWIGWSITGARDNPRFPLGFREGAEIGEFLWGGTVAAAAFIVAMVGT